MHAIPAPIESTDAIIAAATCAQRPGSDLPGIGPVCWTIDELLTWWRTRRYRDPVGRPSLDWRDPIDRTAITLHASNWATPETLKSLLNDASSRAALDDLWCALPPHSRQQLRRLASLAVPTAPAVLR